MNIIFSAADRSFTYTAFLDMLDALQAEGKTTGSNQSEQYLFYARLNLKRMHRLNKTLVLREETRELVRLLPPREWWVITEGWCGDGAQNLPVIAKMAEASEGNISLRIILRDDNLHVMDRYLTGTSRSIPVLVAFSEGGEQLFRWGPRPAGAQMLMDEWKAGATPKPFEEFEKDMHTWYTADKGISIQEELMALLQT